MLFTLILKVLFDVLGAIFSIFPTVTSLPFGLDSVLSTGFGYWNSFLAVFPPLQIVWACFLWFLFYKATMMIFKMFFGARVAHISQ